MENLFLATNEVRPRVLDKYVSERGAVRILFVPSALSFRAGGHGAARAVEMVEAAIGS